MFKINKYFVPVSHCGNVHYCEKAGNGVTDEL